MYVHSLPRQPTKRHRGEEGKRQTDRDRERESTLGMNYVERALIQQSSSEVFVL